MEPAMQAHPVDRAAASPALPKRPALPARLSNCGRVARLASLALAALLAPAVGAAQEADKKIQKQLDQRKVRYEVDADGDFKVTYELADGRTQLAFVRSTTFEYGELRIREILSIGYRAVGAQFPADVANRMLEHNNQAKLGAWAKQDNLAIFTTKIPADADADELIDALEVTVNLADELEKTFTGEQDEF